LILYHLSIGHGLLLSGATALRDDFILSQDHACVKQAKGLGSGEMDLTAGARLGTLTMSVGADCFF
jgi:hypothetical protein